MQDVALGLVGLHEVCFGDGLKTVKISPDSWLLFLNVAISDVLCMNKGKTWSQVMIPRSNVFSVPHMKGWNLRVLTQGL